MERLQILEQIERFDEELAREGLAHSVGLKDTINTSAIFDKYDSLFSASNIKLLKALFDGAMMPNTKRKNLLLYDFLVSGFIGNELKELGDKASNYEAKAKITVGGKKIPFRNVAPALMNEPNRKKRQKIVDAMKKPKAVLTKINADALKKEYALLKKLTGKDYISYYETVKAMNYGRFADDMREFLTQTQDGYTRRLHQALAEMKVPVADAQKHDLAYYHRAHKFDRYFSKKKLVQTLKRTLAGMGFNLDKQKNILLDAEDRPNKVPRAFCSPILVPSEIHLVVKPHGGQEDYQTILHEMGHSQHFANTDADLAYEFKHMGAHNVSESYAFLFEYLTLDVHWLKAYLKMPAKAEKAFLDFLWFNKLFFLRRYAGKVVYEVKLHGNDLRRLDAHLKPMREKYADASEMYADILGRSTGVKYTPEDYLLDVDSGFYSVDYVRAWMFEVQIRKSLQAKFGPSWFRNRKSGTFLKDLWQFGSSGLTQDELAVRIGYPRVDKRYLTQEILNAFGA